MSWLLLAWLFAPGANVSWVAPPTCPDPASVELRLESADVRLAQPVVARVVAPPSGGSTWRLEVQMADTPPRLIEGESCDALADALVAILSVQATAGPPIPVVPEPELAPPAVPTPPAIPSATETAMGPGERQPAERQPAELQPTESPPAERQPLREGRAPKIVLGIAGAVHGVGVPRPGGGVGAAAGLRYPHVRIMAYGRWWFRRDQEVIGGIEAAYRLAVGGIEACGVASFGSFDALGCGLGELGELRAEGISAAPSRTQRHLWLAPGFRLGTQWRTRRSVRLGLSAVALVPLVRRRFTVGDAPAGQVGPVELRGIAHVVFAIPSRRAKKRDAR